MATQVIIYKAFILLILILSIAFHEYGHARVAKWLGDDRAERDGRVTLNPLKHISLIFSVLLPGYLIYHGLAIFGAGKPVMVNPERLRRPAFDMMLISVAGPLVNVLLALMATAAMHVAVDGLSVDPLSDTGLLLLMAVRINLLLAVFNLLPVPPLDGHRVLALFLPRALREIFYRMWILGLLLLLYLFVGGGSELMYRRLLLPMGEWYLRLLPDGIGTVF